MKNTFIGCFIFLISAINIRLNASVEVQSQHLTTSHGLSNNSVRHIFQDSKGFIWMSTLNGLNRYDGNSFVNFRPSNDAGIYLADHRGRTLKEDKNGFLWISTAADLFSCYDLKKDCFVDFTGCGEYLYNYRHMAVFSDDIWLWGISDGCRRVTYKDGVFSSEAFNIDSQHLSSDHVRFMSQGVDGRIWVGTTEGLYFYENGRMKCVNETHYFQWTCKSHNKDFFISTEGTIWVYHPESGLSEIAHIPHVLSGLDLPGELILDGKWIIFTSKGGYSLNTESHTLQPASSDLNIPGGEVIRDNHSNYWVFNKTGSLNYIHAKSGEIKKFQLMPKEKVGFIDMERYHIIHDSRDIIWITTYGNGLFTYDLKNDQLEHIMADSNGSNLISSNFLLALMEDRAGNIWVSSEFTGISCLRVINEGALRFYPGKNKPQKDHSSTIRLIQQMNNGDIWVGARDGKVFVYDSELHKQKEEFHYEANVYAVCEDTTGVKWKGSRGDGVFVGNKNYVYDVKDPASVSSNEIFSMLRDSKGRMWVGTFGGGLNLAVPDAHKGYVFRHFFNKTYGQRRIRALCEDNNGWIWTGTSDGILIFHPEKLLKDPEDYYQYNWKNKYLLSDEVRSVTRDSKGNFWIAETGAGFCVCTPGGDYGNLTFTHYGVQDGLISSMVQGFVEDANGRMWITTEYGVSCFDPEKKTFQNYLFSSDMLSNVYCESSALRLQDGRLIMGTNYGLVMIDPTYVEKKSGGPTVTFTDLKLNGISAKPNDPDSPIDCSLAYAESVHLKHFQNSFMVDFSTLDYSASESTKFSYQLENYDEEWSEPSTMHFAAYKNVNPGTYYLHVKACNVDGIWGMQDAVMTIVVEPPFWQTTWAFLIYILLIATTLYIAYRIIHNMNELRYKIKVEEQLTEYKLVFFTNISHEFRTPLTLIQGALERMRRVGKIPREMAYSVKMMDKSTQRMLRLINQLLEFRKMQNNKLALSLEETDIIAFLREIYVSFKEAAESKKMKFRFTPSVASYKMFIDEGKLDKIVYNLLSNAFKYTPSGGKIDLNVTIDEKTQHVLIKVSDSGVGIPPDKRDQLFKRFMQSSFSGSSVGVGLHLTYELVNVHKGTINYEENDGEGSIFTVKLSTDLSIYKEEDFLIQDNVLLHEENILKNRLPVLGTDEESGEDEAVDNEKELMPEVPLNKRRILIIEDDNDVREFLKEELCSYFEVVAEADGESGLEYASTEDVDLIVCDVMMPGCSGFEVTKRLKDEFSTSHIPIILLTALSDSESHLEGVESGADAYITKPFSSKLLLARILKLIEQRDKLREKFSSDLSMVRPAICTTNKDKEFIEKMTHIMEEQLENPEFTVDEFASMMALGRTIFYRKIRGVTGYSPKEYIRIMRMKKAAELLQTTLYTVSEVAYKVGINDPSYFSKCFKDQFGVAPSVYLKNAEKNTDE